MRKEEPMELVYMDGKKEPYTLSSIVAECAEIKHRHLKVLLNKHREDFESFGKVQFKISPSESGQNVRDYILNEQQATLLITYLRNTEPVKEFKKNLVKGKKEPYTLSSIVAECAEIKHRHLKVLLNKHREDFESFGKVQFKISPSESGQNVRDYILNEQQATLLITYLRNTEPVKEFKKNLVKAFFEMREELSKFRMQRALEKPKRKTLHDSIENWEQAPKHAHSTMNNLLLKAVTDRNAKQLVEERGGYNGIDSLTSEELEQYQAFEDMAIAMISLNMSYQEIKAMAFRNKKTRQTGA